MAYAAMPITNESSRPSNKSSIVTPITQNASAQTSEQPAVSRHIAPAGLESCSARSGPSTHICREPSGTLSMS